MEPYRSPADAPAPQRVDLTDAELRLPRRRPALGRIVLIVLLVAAVTGITLLAPGRGDVPSIALIASVSVVVTFALLLLLGRRLVGLSRIDAEGVSRLNAGDVDAAIRIFADLVRRSRRWPNYRAQFIANLGVAHLRAGDLDRGIECLERAHASGHLDTRRTAPNYLALLNALAIGYALKGALDRAKTYEAEASKRAEGRSRGALVFVQVVLAARAKDFGAVEAICAAGWHEAEGALPPFQMRVLRLLRAFGRDAGTAGASEGETRGWIEGARPSRPGEFDYLGANWPEFRSFLVQHGFASGGAKSASVA